MRAGPRWAGRDRCWGPAQERPGPFTFVQGRTIGTKSCVLIDFSKNCASCGFVATLLRCPEVISLNRRMNDTPASERGQRIKVLHRGIVVYVAQLAIEIRNDVFECGNRLLNGGYLT